MTEISINVHKVTSENKKNQFRKYRLFFLFALGVIILLFSINIYGFFSLNKEECVKSFVKLTKFDSEQEFYQYTTKHFQQDHSFNKRNERIDGWPRIDNIDPDMGFVGKMPISNFMFFCPFQGDNKFPFGCNGIGYSFKKEGGSCKLDEYQQYFD